MAEKKLAIERARRKGAIQPFPGQSGWPYDDDDEEFKEEADKDKDKDSVKENNGGKGNLQLDAGETLMLTCNYVMFTKLSGLLIILPTTSNVEIKVLVLP